MKKLHLITASVLSALLLCACLDPNDPVLTNTPAPSNTVNQNSTVNQNGSNENIPEENHLNGPHDVIEDENNTPEVTVENQDVAVENSDVPLTDSDGSASGYFKTTDLDGNVYTQEIFTKSKLNFVNVWGTFCGPCLNEMPDLGELASEYDTKDVQFIGIVCDVYDYEDAGYAKKCVSSTGADYLHLVASDELYYWGLEDMEYVPTTLLIDSDGNILYETVGSQSKSEWKKLIDSYK